MRDHNGFAVAYVYYKSEPGRRAAANFMKDEAQRGQHRQAAEFASAGGTLVCRAVHSGAFTFSASVRTRRRRLQK